jgi:tRNA A37 threonylcarbamoyladenosine synthetase subunit TsaC/SUA5/YrdC
VPTDSSYALVCHLDDKAAADQLRRIRQVDDKHHLTLLCRDLRELANYAIVDNRSTACSSWPRRGPTPSSWKPPRKCRAASATRSARPSACACPSTRPAGTAGAARRAAAGHHADPAGRDRAAERRREIRERFDKQIAGVIDAGACPLEPTTVVDLTPMGTGGGL